MSNGGLQSEGMVSLAGGLPATAIQALYHAATGKTENLTKRLSKNFIIRRSDLDQLYFKILQQLEHFEKIAGPTVTIKIVFNNKESQQFSSWDRFKLFDSSKKEIVSDVVLKFEFLIKLPDLPGPQRYILNIDIDSRLCVVSEDDGGDFPFRVSSILNLILKLPSLIVSIDFIDYLCAKNFLQIVEDWFAALESSPTSKWAKWGSQESITWPRLFRQLANLGAAAFLALYAYLKGGNLGGPTEIAYLGSIIITVWTLSSLICGHIGNLFSASIVRSFVPATVLLTTGDERAYAKVQARAKAATPKLIGYILKASSALIFNVVASFLYAWLIR
jgi:hypothetical protein